MKAWNRETSVKLHRAATVVVVAIIVIAGLAGPVVLPAAAGQYTSPADNDRYVPIVSTRGHFDVGWFPVVFGGASPLEDFDPYDTTGDIPGMETGPCPAELVIYVHEFNNDESGAITNFNTAARTLQANGYAEPVVGYSWDSKPSVTMVAWRSANKIAIMNGPKLAQFVDDYLEACPATNIRFIAHSLGTRVVLEATQTLHERYPGGPLIHSAHFVGSAVGNDEVTYQNGYGSAIDHQIGQLHNKYSREDMILRVGYTAGELSLSPLGKIGLRPGYLAPMGYFEEDVTPVVGSDHSGYIGSLDANGDVVDDGIIDHIVRGWRNESRYGDYPGPSSPAVHAELLRLRAEYDDRFPVIGKVLFTNQDIQVHFQRDALGGESYWVKMGAVGEVTDLQPQGRYITGQRSLWFGQVLVDDELTSGVYRPTRGPSTAIYLDDDTFLAVVTGCGMLESYRAGVADGRIQHDLDMYSRFQYETLIKRAPTILRMIDRPGGDVGSRC